MTRTPLAIAAALFGAAVFLVPAAEACISCEYTPEVVTAGEKAPKARQAGKKRTGAPKRAARPAQKRIVKRPPPARQEQVEPAKAEATATAAPASPAETESAEETRSETTNTAAPATAASDTTTPEAGGSATTAFAARDAARAQEATEQPEAEVGCKRYSAQAGTTVTVPCE